MRGADRQTAAMFSYLSPEAFVPTTPPLRAIRPLVNAALERLSPDFAKIYSAFGRESCAGEVTAGTAAASLLLNPLRAAVDGAVDLQHHVSLVRWPFDGRLRVGCHRVHQKPRPSAGRRYRAPLPGCDPGGPAGQAAAVGRAFFGRRYHD